VPELTDAEGQQFRKFADMLIGRFGEAIMVVIVTIEEFSARYRFRVTKDACGDQIIQGRPGDCHVFEWNDKYLGWMFMPDPKCKRPPATGAWNNRRRLLLAAGVTITCDVDGEGYGYFDPNDERQVRAMLKVTGIRPKRQVSAAQLAILFAHQQRFQPST